MAGSADAQMKAALDPSARDAVRIPADSAVAAASLPAVSVTGRVGDNPAVTFAQIFNNHGGPLPLSAPLTTHGGTLAIFVSGSGTVANFDPTYWYICGVTVSIDGGYVGQATVWINDQGRHGFSNVLIADSIQYGDHTIAVDNFKDNLATTAWDLFNLTVLEL